MSTPIGAKQPHIHIITKNDFCKYLGIANSTTMWTTTRVNWKLPAVEVVHTFHLPSTKFDIMKGLTAILETDVLEFLRNMSSVEFVFIWPPSETFMSSSFSKTTTQSNKTYSIDIDQLIKEADDDAPDDLPSMLKWISAAAKEHLESGTISSIDVKITYA